MKKSFAFIFSIFACIMFIAVCFVTSLESVAFDRSFYLTEYRALNRMEAIGISEDDLMKGTDALIVYMQGKSDDLKVPVDIHGESRDLFTKDEITHMEDVQDLFTGTLTLRNVFAVLIVILIIAAILLTRRESARIITKSYFIVFGVFAAILIALGIWVAIDFSSFWTMFHLVFFTNDLWIMDPSTSIMIQMFPGQFFFDMIFKIAVQFLIVIVIVLLVFIVVRIGLRALRKTQPKAGKKA